MLKIKKLNAGYGDRDVVKNINITLNKGFITGVIGASGSGKSTLLKSLSGKVRATKGVLQIEDNLIDLSEELLTPERTNVYLVDQEFDLMPYLNVYDNIKKSHLNLSPTAIKRGVQISSKEIGISRLKKQKANTLSGGQKQRTALASAFLGDAKLLLFDEPFSHLDFDLKQKVKNLIRNQSENIYTLIALHEPADFLELCDELVVLEKGKVIQKGTSTEVYYNPVNEYVASLTGYYTTVTPELASSLKITGKSFIRPDEFMICKSAKKSFIKATVLKCGFMGLQYLLYASWQENNLIISSPQHFEKGADIWLKCT